MNTSTKRKCDLTARHANVTRLRPTPIICRMETFKMQITLGNVYLLKLSMTEMLLLNFVHRSTLVFVFMREGDHVDVVVNAMTAGKIVHETRDADEEQEEHEHYVEHDQRIDGHQLHSTH